MAKHSSKKLLGPGSRTSNGPSLLTNRKKGTRTFYNIDTGTRIPDDGDDDYHRSQAQFCSHRNTRARKMMACIYSLLTHIYLLRDWRTIMGFVSNFSFDHVVPSFTGCT